jgi:hypothetical protein
MASADAPNYTPPWPTEIRISGSPRKVHPPPEVILAGVGGTALALTQATRTAAGR